MAKTHESEVSPSEGTAHMLSKRAPPREDGGALLRTARAMRCFIELLGRLIKGPRCVRQMGRVMPRAGSTSV